MAYFGLPSNLLFTFGSSTSFSLFFTEGQNDIDTSYVLAQFNGKKQLTCIIFIYGFLVDIAHPCRSFRRPYDSRPQSVHYNQKRIELKKALTYVLKECHEK